MPKYENLGQVFGKAHELSPRRPTQTYPKKRPGNIWKPRKLNPIKKRKFNPNDKTLQKITKFFSPINKGRELNRSQQNSTISVPQGTEKDEGSFSENTVNFGKQKKFEAFHEIIRKYFENCTEKKENASALSFGEKNYLKKFSEYLRKLDYDQKYLEKSSDLLQKPAENLRKETIAQSTPLLITEDGKETENEKLNQLTEETVKRRTETILNFDRNGIEDVPFEAQLKIKVKESIDRIEKRGGPPKSKNETQTKPAENLRKGTIAQSMPLLITEDREETENEKLKQLTEETVKHRTETISNFERNGTEEVTFEAQFKTTVEESIDRVVSAYEKNGSDLVAEKNRDGPPKSKTNLENDNSLVAKKKRGRPPKSKLVSGENEGSENLENDNSLVAKKKRGRPPKSTLVSGENEGSENLENDNSLVAKKKRGRPPKSKLVSGENGGSENLENENGFIAKKKRGRPQQPKLISGENGGQNGSVEKKKRGRPPKPKAIQNYDNSRAKPKQEKSKRKRAATEKRSRPGANIGHTSKNSVVFSAISKPKFRTVPARPFKSTKERALGVGNSAEACNPEPEQQNEQEATETFEELRKLIDEDVEICEPTATTSDSAFHDFIISKYPNMTWSSGESTIFEPVGPKSNLEASQNQQNVNNSRFITSAPDDLIIPDFPNSNSQQGPINSIASTQEAPQMIANSPSDLDTPPVSSIELFENYWNGYGHVDLYDDISELDRLLNIEDLIENSGEVSKDEKRPGIGPPLETVDGLKKNFEEISKDGPRLETGIGLKEVSRKTARSTPSGFTENEEEPRDRPSLETEDVLKESSGKMSLMTRTIIDDYNSKLDKIQEVLYPHFLNWGMNTNTLLRRIQERDRKKAGGILVRNNRTKNHNKRVQFCETVCNE